jgi:hypothetical protein
LKMQSTINLQSLGIVLSNYEYIMILLPIFLFVTTDIYQKYNIHVNFVNEMWVAIELIILRF